MLAQEAAEGLTWSAILDSTVQVAIILGALAAAYAGLRRWVQRAAADGSHHARQAAEQIATSNGHTAGQLIEKTAEEIGEMRHELTTLDRWAVQNRETAQAALALARHVGERLDAHLTGHEKGSGS